MLENNEKPRSGSKTNGVLIQNLFPIINPATAIRNSLAGKAITFL